MGQLLLCVQEDEAVSPQASINLKVMLVNCVLVFFDSEGGFGGWFQRRPPSTRLFSLPVYGTHAGVELRVGSANSLKIISALNLLLRSA